jgi:transposase-like protein
MGRRSSHQRRSVEEWQSILEAQERSGLSRLAFCRREGIPPTTFDKWKRRLRSVGAFLELTPRMESGPWELEVTLPAGVVLRFRR